MTEIQRTNIEVCNQIIAQLGQDKPFNLSLNVDQTKAVHDTAAQSHAMSDNYIRNLTVATWSHSISGNGCQLLIGNENADELYHMLSSYIEKHDLPEEVK